MNLFKAEIKSSNVVRPGLWMIGFALTPWIILSILAFAIHPLLATVTHPYARSGFGVLLLGFLAGAVLIYEQWFGALAVAILQKDYDPELDDHNYQRIFPAPEDGKLLAALKAGRAPKAEASVIAEAKNKMDAVLGSYAESNVDSTLPEALGVVARAAEWFSKASDLRFERMRYILDRLQSRIGEEYGDIVSRTGWLMTAQAFLLGAFVAILNAERLADEARHWFATGVAFSGATISLVLALSTFFGHALIVKLKKPRDAAEKIMAEEFHLPRAGVPVLDSAHRLGHAATRYLPTFAYVGWVFLTLLALSNHLTKKPDDADRINVQVLPYESLTHPSFTAGWELYREPTPPFPIGSTTYHEPDKACPDNSKAADDWVNRFVALWLQRVSPSAKDGLVLVGSADRLTLGQVFKRKIDSNVSLARGRAEEIKRRLIATTEKLEPQHRISDEHVLLLVTGPLNIGLSTPSAAVKPECRDDALAADRTVQVWMPVRN